MNGELRFEPERWHACREDDWQDCEDGVNCYSYALNRPEYHWSVPGFGFIKIQARNYIEMFNAFFQNYSFVKFREKLIKGAIADGLIKIDEPVDREGYYLVALVFPSDDNDFHWYRKDDNGLWSHKDGWEKATNKDDERKIIKDPRNAARNLYPIFGSFFLVPRGGIHITKTFPEE